MMDDFQNNPVKAIKQKQKVCWSTEEETDKRGDGTNMSKKLLKHISADGATLHTHTHTHVSKVHMVAVWLL